MSSVLTRAHTNSELEILDGLSLTHVGTHKDTHKHLLLNYHSVALEK